MSMGYPYGSIVTLWLWRYCKVVHTLLSFMHVPQRGQYIPIAAQQPPPQKKKKQKKKIRQKKHTVH